MYKVLLSILFISLSSLTLACKNVEKTKIDSFATWLGQNSNFSKAYKSGKCALDEAFMNIPISQRKVLANLIAKSYKYEENKFKVKEKLNF